MSKNYAVVTGAAGFIGSHLALGLLKNDYIVIGIDNFFRGTEDNLLPLRGNKNFIFFNCDLSSQEECKSLKQKIGSIIKNARCEIYHYAAINGTKYFYDFPFEVFSKNVSITENTLSLLDPQSIKKFIFASSSEVYGFNPPTPTSELHEIVLNIEADRDSYACSKVHNEFLIKLFCQKNDIDYLILRLFNVYGPNMVSTDYGQVVPEFIRRFKEGKFSIIGDGLQTRSFCYIDDNIQVTLKASSAASDQVLNIGNDEEVTILELAKLIHKIGNKNFDPVFLPARKNDTLVRKPCNKKLFGFIGKHEFLSLEQGITKLLK